jgi:hypothetical protein
LETAQGDIVLAKRVIRSAPDSYFKPDVYVETWLICAQSGMNIVSPTRMWLKGGDPMKEIGAGVLDVAYLDLGPAGGPVAVLLHGFPYDVHAYDKVTDVLVAAGCRCIIPYLRGYGGTQFISWDTPRSGEQAALGAVGLNIFAP